MIETLALLAVGCIGYFTLLDVEPRNLFRERMKDWFGMVAKAGVAAPIPSWLAVVALPALVVGLLNLALTNDLLNFAFHVTVLLLTTAIGSFMSNHKSLLRAVYANDSSLASQIANNWQRDGVALVDGKENVARRMCEMCAQRLHDDVLAPLVWYMLLGPAGAVLFAAHLSFSRLSGHPTEPFKLFVQISDEMSIVLIGVSGNMSAALAALPHTSIKDAFLRVADMDPERIDIESVPAYGKLLRRTAIIGVGIFAFIHLNF